MPPELELESSKSKLSLTFPRMKNAMQMQMQDYTFLPFKVIHNIDFRRAQLDIYIRLNTEHRLDISNLGSSLPSFNLAILKKLTSAPGFREF